MVWGVHWGQTDRPVTPRKVESVAWCGGYISALSVDHSLVVSWSTVKWPKVKRVLVKITKRQLTTGSIEYYR